MGPTETLVAQRQVERSAAAIFREIWTDTNAEHPERQAVLRREDHVQYLSQILSRDRSLPKSFACLNAGRTWICFWAIHALYLLGAIDELVAQNPDDAATMVSFLASCQHETLGGFGGGPGQLPHLATTYAAVSALVTLGTDEALAVIDRPKVMAFLLSMCRRKNQGGGMTMHDGGEVDVRGCYCALCVCYLLGMDGTGIVEACDMGDFVRRCQGHEGGIGGEPGNEGHGGYTFCAYGALALAETCGWLPGGTEMIDKGLLVSWVTRMQGSVEGGMRGRTNKLVDGCYSMWQGGLSRLLSIGAHLSDVTVAGTVARGEDLGKCGRKSQEIERGNAILSAAVRDWCSDGSSQRSRLTVMEGELDQIMERFLVAEERCRASSSDKSACLAVEKLGDDAVRLQHELQELEEDLRSAQDSTKCLQRLLVANGAENSTVDGQGIVDIIDMEALQMWILLGCQVPGRGGLRDKPGTHVDFYHTCYCLSGLSVAQASLDSVGARGSRTIGGDPNRLQGAHPICNVGINKIERSIAYFASRSMVK